MNCPSYPRILVIGLFALIGFTAHAQLSFDFNFTDNNSGFNDPSQGAARRAALEAAGQELSNQLPINRAVTITFDVSSNNANDDTLASAGSGFVGDEPGFYPTIAQRKVIDGVDGNGATADGEIEWNFFHDWDLDNDVAPESFDFISTAMHEILHALGFLGAVYSDGTGYFEGNIGEPNAWATFDQYLVNASGVKVIDEQFAFKPAELGTLTGGSSLFFSGANAMAANNGQPIVIYSPDPWEDGSSASHTDDETYTDANQLLMNAGTATGPGIRTLSAMELGVLRDLGYEFTAPSGFAYLTNISVRTNAGSGSQTLIAGFAVKGGDKPLLIRGIGPTLGDFNVGGAMADPSLSLFSGQTATQSNDNWNASATTIFQSVGAFALPDGSLDSALVATVSPGAYTAQLTGNNGGTGIALAEIYDTAFPTSTTGPRLSNISARSQVGTGPEVLVAGFVIRGSGTKRLLIRGVGPTLTQYDVTGVIADPRLTLFRSNGDGTSTELQSNDNWDSATVSTTADTVGAFSIPAGSLDAALLVNLEPGTYTVQLSGNDGGTGVGLIEVYDAD
ncbi:MAG: hypothetical protein SynsKO_16480 [Synoicihabitans sp.]